MIGNSTMDFTRVAGKFQGGGEGKPDILYMGGTVFQLFLHPCLIFYLYIWRVFNIFWGEIDQDSELNHLFLKIDSLKNLQT